jgi:hypothetical protein
MVDKRWFIKVKEGADIKDIAHAIKDGSAIIIFNDEYCSVTEVDFDSAIIHNEEYELVKKSSLQEIKNDYEKILKIFNKDMDELRKDSSEIEGSIDSDTIKKVIDNRRARGNKKDE